MTTQGMKPFNLQDWQNGAKPICRNGYEPQDIYFFKRTFEIVYDTSEGKITTRNSNGLTYLGTSVHDLFLKAEKKEGWVVLKNNIVYCTTVFDTLEILMERKNEFGENILFAKIEWYE